MMASMFGGGPAMFAKGWRIRMKASTIFARWGMVCEGASHTTRGLNVIAGERQEEAFHLLIADVRFEQSALAPYLHPSSAFVRLGLGKNAPMSVHVPFEFAKEIRPKDLDGRGRT